MPQSVSPFISAPTNPHDLFQVARDFLDGIGDDAASASPFITFSASFPSSQLNSRWTALLASVPAGFQGTFLRCINANLRSFHPKIAQRLNADPNIAVALTRAKTDRADVRIIPAMITPMLTYSYYASLADTFGDSAVQSELAGGQLLLVGVRNSVSTLVNEGLGAYDDAIVVIKGMGLGRTAIAFPACTEPGAQYAHRAQLKPKGKPGERLDDRYAGVKRAHIEGMEVNGDEFLDAGRLVEGTYQYTEKSGGHLGARAFRVGSRIQKGKKSIFTSGPNQVAERDTDGDGFFTAADPSRIDPTGAGTTMYIHQGGTDNTATVNTWSAGCQTIPRNRFATFLSHIPVNATFHYVLINAAT
jgi:hypothetical protein